MPSTPPTTCRDCQAWVHPGATHCSLCGIVLPTARPWRLLGLPWTQAQVGGVLGALAGAALGAIVGLSCRDVEAALAFVAVARWLAIGGLGALGGLVGRSMSGRPGLVRGALVGVAIGVLFGPRQAVYHPWTLGLGAGLGLLGVLGVLGGRRLDRTLAERDPRCVRTLRTQTLDRLQRLEADARRMTDLQERLAREVAPTHRPAALHALDVARDATDRQRQRDGVTLWRLAVAEWQNPLQPIQSGWRTGTLAECETWLRTLQDAESSGRRRLEAWQDDPLGQTDAGRRVVRQLEHLLGAVARLREAVLLRQTAVLAAGSPGVREAFVGTELPAETLRDIERLRELPDLQEVGTAVLDEAALRVQSEQLAVLEVEGLTGIQE